jgi:hypothetical protein
VAEHHTLVSSLLGGYHLAFTVGMASIVVGIVTALVALRTRALSAARETSDPGPEPEPALEIGIEADLPFERQAA